MIRVLGPVTLVRADGVVADLPPQRQKVLALLAISPSALLPIRKLVERVWTGDPPKHADAIVRQHLRWLRIHLGRDVLKRRSAGNYLDTDRVEIDSVQFRGLFEESCALYHSGDYAAAAARVKQALGLWRDAEALIGLRDDLELNAEAMYWEELRWGAEELRISCFLVGGRTVQALSLLKGMVLRHPRRERLWAQLMVAEVLEGRIREALEVTYPAAFGRLVEETGMDAPLLGQIHQAILQERQAADLITAVTFSSDSTT